MKGKFLLLLFALLVLTANARKTNGALDVLRRVCGNTSVPVQLELKKDAGSMYYTRVRDNILKSKEQKNIQLTKGGHKMVTCQNYVSLFYCQITSCPSDGGIS